MNESRHGTSYFLIFYYRRECHDVAEKVTHAVALVVVPPLLLCTTFPQDPSSHRVGNQKSATLTESSGATCSAAPCHIFPNSCLASCAVNGSGSSITYPQ